MCDKFVYSHKVEASIQYFEIGIDLPFDFCIGFKTLALETPL